MEKKPRGAVLLLSLVFFLSGFSALIFQVAWQRLLTVDYGVGAVSIAIIVSVYMLGLGLGALGGGWLAERVRGRLTVYALVETAIGGFGLVSLPFLTAIGKSTAGQSYYLTFAGMFVFLSLPTFLMGSTLPLLIKIFNSRLRNYWASVSFLYSINTLGAAGGALAAAYGLISFGGLDIAIYSAAGLDFFLAALMVLAGRLVQSDPGPGRPRKAGGEAILGRGAYPLALITGFLALGYEMIWYRLIGVLVKDSPYAFSTILFVYLFSLALGSWGINRFLRRRPGLEKKSLFFFAQFLLGLSVMITILGYYYLTRDTAFGELTRASFAEQVHPLLAGAGYPPLKRYFLALDVLIWPICFEAAPAVLMGAGFPLIAFLALANPEREGQTTGAVYFVNTLGNVLGALATGFLLLPAWGAEHTLLIFSSANVLMLAGVSALGRWKPPRSVLAAAAMAIIAAAIIAFPGRGRLYAVIHVPPGPDFEAYFQEGVDGVVMTYQRDELAYLFINGMGHGVRPGPQYAFQTITAMSYVPEAQNVLIIGFGLGTATETVLQAKEVQRVTQVEINRTLMDNLANMAWARSILSDPRVQLVLDDGRRHLLRTGEQYDLILMDPLHAATAYSGNLYSREFFELAADHLKPKGALLVWMDEGRVIPKTLATVFNQVEWYRLGGPQFFVVASRQPLTLNRARVEELIKKFPASQQQEILGNMYRSQYLGDKSEIFQRAEFYAINRDLRPISEYYLGLRTKERFIDRQGERIGVHDN